MIFYLKRISKLAMYIYVQNCGEEKISKSVFGYFKTKEKFRLPFCSLISVENNVPRHNELFLFGLVDSRCVT